MGKRMYWILKILLESKDALTREEIVEKLSEQDIYINVKTVSSTIHSLNEFFKEILGDDFVKIIKKKGMVINCELFRDGEIQFILDSIMYHQDLNYSDKEMIKNKLLSFSSINQRDRLSIRTDVSHNDKYSILLNLSVIIKAIENKKTIRFQYVHYEVSKQKLKEVLSDKEKKYHVSPYQIMIQNNHYYLVGYNDKYKGKLSMYRVDRMRNIQISGHTIDEIREQYDMDDLLNKMMNMYVSDVTATLVLECDGNVLREVVSRFGINHTVKKLIDDRYLISIDDVLVSEGLIGWILMLQNKVKVISPASLKEDIKLRIEEMKKIYD